jgi:hypothetical protein
MRNNVIDVTYSDDYFAQYPIAFLQFPINLVDTDTKRAPASEPDSLWCLAKGTASQFTVASTVDPTVDGSS